MTSRDEPQALALRVTGLGFHVGGVEILDDINLDVPRGHLLGIIGPNGAGKSTLLNLLSGIIRPTAGTIEYGGRELNAMRPARRAHLGIGRTFQTSSLFNSQSVFENARLSAQAHLSGSARFWHRPRLSDPASAAALDALGTVGLSEQAWHLTGALSHGDKRKLELAILVAADADVLLLDEPMAGVNSEDVPVLTELIRRLHDEGRTVMLVEHHMAVVIGLAQTIAVLDSGHLLAHGDPTAVVANDDVQRAYLGQPL
ncbi:MAG: ABC transporter ATP-binding protein [Acidimicrobiales bacterium]